MISIRHRLRRELVGVVLVLLVVGCSVLFFAAREAVVHQFDYALQAKARAVSTLIRESNGEIRIEFTDRFLPGFERRKPRDFFQLWNSDDRELARSESLARGKNLPRRIGKLERPEKWNFTLPNDRPGRAVGFKFQPKSSAWSGATSQQELQVVVASDREDLDETLWQLGGLCGGLAALLVLVTFFMIPRVLRRGLQPLENLGEQAGRIDADSLSARFAGDSLPAELQPIARRLNDLLARLEESFERERRFSADLAHELRTPLAELRSMAECALKWPAARDPSLDQETLAIARQMERMVSHLLSLARGEKGELAVQLEPVALDSTITTVWRTFADRARERQLEVTLSLEPTACVADVALLRTILSNLCENAVDYAPSRGVLLISLRHESDRAELTIANSTTDLTTQDLPRLFERFWRKDAARTGGQHLGLGLALSRSFAAAMNWTLSAGHDDQGLLVFKLAGPLAAPREEPALASNASTT